MKSPTELFPKTKKGDIAPDMGNEYVNLVTALARQTLGREYKLSKNALTLEAEEHLKVCWKQRDLDWFGSTFVDHWAKTYLRFMFAEVFMAVFNKTNDSWLADTVSQAFLGKYYKEYEF